MGTIGCNQVKCANNKNLIITLLLHICKMTMHAFRSCWEALI